MGEFWIVPFLFVEGFIVSHGTVNGTVNGNVNGVEVKRR